MADTNTNLTSFGFFDYQQGDTDAYTYTSDEFSTFISSICADGIDFNSGGGNGSAFVVTNSGNTITVGTGKCVIGGRWGYLSSSTTFSLTVSQQYVLCIACDTLNRNINLHLHEGTTAPAGELKLYSLLWNGSTLTKTDNRSNLWIYPNSGHTASVTIIYSENEPTYQQGAIWLKPVSV